MAVDIRSWSMGFNGADAGDPPPPDFDFGDFLRWGGRFLGVVLLVGFAGRTSLLAFRGRGCFELRVVTVEVAVVVIVVVAVVVAVEA